MFVTSIFILASVLYYVDAQSCGCSNGGMLRRDLNNVRMGDMVLDKQDIMLINGFKAHYASTKTWTGNLVKYAFKSSFPRDKVAKVKECLSEMQRDLKGCVKFQESQSGHHIAVGSDTPGCYSLLGMTRGDNQPLNLENPGCMYSKGTIKHEFIHALGFMHTHMRKDRDQHIDIIWKNILATHCSQFTLCSGCENDGPYETNSVMHYPSYGFGCQQGMDTMLKKGGGKIGYNHETTGNDLNMIRQFYKC